jgi:hypothetical protein
VSAQVDRSGRVVCKGYPNSLIRSLSIPKVPVNTQRHVGIFVSEHIRDGDRVQPATNQS